MNAYKEDQELKDILKKRLDASFFAWADETLFQFAERFPEFDRRAAHTDREGQPRLIKYNRFGDEISEVWVNDGYKQTAEEVYQTGIAAYPHKPIPELNRKGNYIYSYAQGYLLSQIEPGFYCPVTLTMAVALLIDHFADPTLKEKFLPHVLATGETELYEGATFLTEKQGGSDVGANETRAVRDGDRYRLYGLKYFASNAGRCGVAAVLARMEGAPQGTKGLSLFLVPWRKEDGSLNGLSIRRLKDKLGVRAVPSAEVEFQGAEAYLVGDPSKGFYYMMEALNLSRICNAVASVGIMRRAYVEARAYAEKREAFGHKLTAYPLVQQTLVSMACRQEIQLYACFDMIALFDRVMSRLEEAQDEDKALLRLKIALLKIRTAQEAIDFAHQAIELHGGNGYIEDFVTPRLLRDAQVLTVWEGPENILCLEVLRLIKKFKVDEFFIDEVRAIMDRTPDQLAHLLLPVEEAMQTLNAQLEQLKKADAFSETLLVKRITHLMTDIYLSAMALEAAWDGDSRKTVRAEIFINETLKNVDPASDVFAARHFDLIINRTQTAIH